MIPIGEDNERFSMMVWFGWTETIILCKIKVCAVHVFLRVFLVCEFFIRRIKA
jgi:hypothetical protein